MNELAIFGGNPIRKDSFPVWPRVTREMKDSLIDTFENQSWGVGSETIDIFNTEFAKMQE